MLNQKDLSCYYYDRGNYLNDLKLYEEAIQCFDKAIEMRPHQSYLYNCKGVALCELNECEEALLLFDKSIGINPNQSTSYHYKADALLKLGRYKLAIQNYDTAIKMNPNLIKQAMESSNLGLGVQRKWKWTFVVLDWTLSSIASSR